jgi:sugar phosphate permease
MSDPITDPTPGRRWLMWAIPSWLFLIAFFHRPAPGVIAKDLMQAFDATGAIVGLLAATYFYAYAGLMIPGGLLIDAFGVRRVVALGGAVMALGTLAMGMAASQQMLFAGRFAVGMGATVTFIGALKIAATWFPPSEFGTLSAVTATVGILGSFVATAPLAWLVAHAGWRGALGVVAGLTFAGALLCAWLVRDQPTAPIETSAPRLAQVVLGMLEVLRNRHTWPPFVSFFFFYAAFGNLMLWVIPYLRDVYALSRTEAALCATATSLALLPAGPLTGYVSDRVLRRRKLPYLVLTLAYLAAWIAFVSTLGRIPLAAVYAMLFAMGAVGGAFVLTWPIGREVNPPELAGVAVAVVNLGGFLGAALTQGLVGAVLDARWLGVLGDGARVYPLDAYHTAFSVCVGFVVAAAVAALFVRETRCANVHAKRLQLSQSAGTAAPRASARR